MNSQKKAFFQLPVYKTFVLFTLTWNPILDEVADTLLALLALALFAFALLLAKRKCQNIIASSKSVIRCFGLIFTPLKYLQVVSIIQSITHLKIIGERTQPSHQFLFRRFEDFVSSPYTHTYAHLR